MDKELLKKILLRGIPPLAVVVLMLYYTFYVGNNAGKLLKEKDRQKQEQEQLQPKEIPGNPPAPPASETKQQDKGNTASEQQAAVPQEEQPLVFGQVFTGAFWQDREPAQWQKLFLAFADEAANGVLPLKSCGEYRSEFAFSAEMRNGEWHVSSQSAGRYAKYVKLLCSVETSSAVKLFQQQQSALDTLLQEMGFAGLDSLTLTRQALAVFADMPVPDEDPALLKGDGGIYIWKDNELERLSPIRKMCLRMGVENARLIKDKATKILSQITEATENKK
ncbi:MAG: DUF3014 domain-containing protein [Victivallales bacterium]|nr:DUF3014 domain-containing protein [Victivallales bacterium]